MSLSHETCTSPCPPAGEHTSVGPHNHTDAPTTSETEQKPSSSLSVFTVSVLSCSYKPPTSFLHTLHLLIAFLVSGLGIPFAFGDISVCIGRDPENHFFICVPLFPTSAVRSPLQVLCNAFTICDAEMQGVGVGLYPSMSLLNHSCDPNCTVVFNGPHLLLRAVRDIEAGEELTICYLDLLMTSEDRRKHLRGQYCFDCDCVRCQTQDKDADMLTGDEQVWKEVQESLKKIEELKAQWKWEQVLAMCQAILSSNAERLPDINIYQLKVLDCAMDACIHLGLLEEALFYGLRTMEPYRIFFPGSHPVRGVQVMKVGKLQLHQGMFPQAMKNLRLAFDIMRVTHGREHRLMEDLILLLEECGANIRAS